MQQKTQKMSSTDTLKSVRTGHTAPPKRWGVFLLNDDYTTMDFVVDVLTEIFLLPPERAVAVMLTVHQQGKALCGVYGRDIAETKCRQVERRAAEAGFPLLCTLEEME